MLFPILVFKIWRVIWNVEKTRSANQTFQQRHKLLFSEVNNLLFPFWEQFNNFLWNRFDLFIGVKFSNLTNTGNASRFFSRKRKHETLWICNQSFLNCPKLNQLCINYHLFPNFESLSQNFSSNENLTSFQNDDSIKCKWGFKGRVTKILTLHNPKKLLSIYSMSNSGHLFEI